MGVQYLISLTIILLVTVNAQAPGETGATTEASYTYREVLDPGRGLVLGWRVHSRAKTIVFHVEFPPTDEQIILGLTIRDRLTGADVIVIGTAEGRTYVRDLYGVDNSTIRVDNVEHWQLIGTESINNGTRTVVHIQRALDTCDEQDVAIKGELINVVWDYSDNQTLPSSLQPQGSKPIFFQDPITLPISANISQIRADASVWRLRRRYRLPPRRTSYWCSINKLTPSLSRQHHIVGFDAYFETPEVRRHIHHQLMYRCSVPPGMDPVKVFEPFVTHPGEECYLNADPQLPSAYCRELVHVWTVGGESVMLPESMGIPIGDTPNEYYLFEAHYDNPEERSDLEVVNGVDILYTSQLRPNAGSILLVGYGVLGTFVVPPNTSGFDVVGHCGKACTTLMLGLSSTNVLGVSLHAHQATRKMRLRQYRGTQELPWIQDDQDYHFDYQQTRFHPEPKTILPGDHLVVQCSYDTTNRNGSALAFGYSTQDEMCLAFLFVDKRLPYLTCTSEYPTLRTMARFGILNMTWDIDLAERVVNAADNPIKVGRTLSQVVETHTEWTPERVIELETAQMYQSHQQSCPPWRLVGAGVAATSLLGPVGDVFQPYFTPTLNTLQTPTPLPVTYPPVTTAYSPPTCSL